jgi:catechol 1,2-dioxygenase
LQPSGYTSRDPSWWPGGAQGAPGQERDGAAAATYEFVTVIPVPYTIPARRATGKADGGRRLEPWRPAHIHLIVSADGHEPLVTQLFIDTRDYLDDDVASAVELELIVHPEATGDGDQVFTYDFALAPARTPAISVRHSRASRAPLPSTGPGRRPAATTRRSG